MCKHNLGIRLNRDESRISVNDNNHWMNKSTNYHLPSYHPLAPRPPKKSTFSSLLRKGESDDDRFLVCQQFWQTNNVSDEILILFRHRSDVMESLRLPSSCTVWGEPDLFCNLFKLSHCTFSRTEPSLLISIFQLTFILWNLYICVTGTWGTPTSSVPGTPFPLRHLKSSPSFRFRSTMIKKNFNDDDIMS